MGVESLLAGTPCWPNVASMELTSASFAHGESIPVRHTCDGANSSPPLAWSGVPDGAKSLALIVDDPDAPDPAAPRRVWVHWLLYNIAPALTSLPEGGARSPTPREAREGLNDSGDPGYEGPCPPIGRHRYYHRLFALDAILPDLGPRASRRDLDAAMRGHVLDQAELMGTYARR
ncbi:MAG: YbhB/YbcL family Raf kinase inhibitor-like protein [Gemmatimonadetes bacterium]|nr:YbhB/YbcL family Raf kinase inhibitor-like protein [Gemmatimonadota bacterium]